MRLFPLFAVLLAACTTTPSEGPPEGDASARAAATEFLAAFTALDAERFDPFFAPDVTMFFPDGPFPQDRVAGKEAVTAAFHRFFQMARARGTTRLNIEPLDLEVQSYGTFAVATFHLRGNGNIGRRSIVWRRDGGRWLIVHFHASSLEGRQPSS